MTRSFSCVLALVATTGCAKRTDEAVRRAWDDRSTSDDPMAQQPTTGPDAAEAPQRRRRGEARRRAAGELRGWARVEHLLTRASSVMARSPEPDVLARLAQRWCEVEPEPTQTDDGWVRVCDPAPPVNVDGHAFTLEVGAVGVIGLVASDLSRPDSSALLKEALRETKGMCSRPWQDIPSLQFHTCPIEGGSTLAVGRTGKDKQGAQWMVSISILGAS